MTQDEALQSLLDQDAIRDLTMRYALGVDRRDYALVASCFAPEATFAHEGVFEAVGVPQILDRIRRIERYRVTMHTMGTQRITVTGDRAETETYAVAYHRGEKEGRDHEIVGGIRYLDTLERRDGRWLIVRRSLSPFWHRGESLIHVNRA